MSASYPIDTETLEALLPSAAGEAFTVARQHSLASGHSIMQSEYGFIYEVYPNGTARLVDVTDPPIQVDPSYVIELP